MNRASSAPSDPFVRFFLTVRRPFLLVGGLGAGVLAVLAWWLFPGPGDVANEPYRRVSCAAAAERLSEAVANGDDGELFVVISGSTRAWRERPSQTGLFHFGCDDQELMATGSVAVGDEAFVLASRSAFLVRANAEGYLEIYQSCLGCENVGEDATYRMINGAVVARIFMTALSVILLMLYRSRGRARLDEALRQAPSREMWGDTTTVVSASLEPLSAGETSIELHSRSYRLDGTSASSSGEKNGPTIELGELDGPFRERPAGPPLFFGPGQVNGLSVESDRGTPIQGGDVIVVARKAYRLIMNGGDGLELRYHDAGAGKLRFLTDLGSRRFRVPQIIAFIAVAAALGLHIEGAITGWLAFGIIVVAAFAAIVLTPRFPSLRQIDLDVSDRTPLTIGELGPGEISEIRLDDLDRGGYELVFGNRQGQDLLVEHVPGWGRSPRPEERALRAALRREAEVIERRLRALIDFQ